jgi:hypothetical protein
MSTRLPNLLKGLGVKNSMTQVVEHLPSKHKALSSNPSMAKREREKYLNTQSLQRPFNILFLGFISCFCLFVLFFKSVWCFFL